MRRHGGRRAAACQCGDQAERGQPLWLQDSADIWSGDLGSGDVGSGGSGPGDVGPEDV